LVSCLSINLSVGPSQYDLIFLDCFNDRVSIRRQVGSYKENTSQ